jgi:hypothetical protein
MRKFIVIYAKEQDEFVNNVIDWLDEFPASKKLTEDYEKKNVTFLSVSIDSDYEKWEKASLKLYLKYNENSLLAINFPNADFYKELNLKTIPRYMIFNAEGKLIHKNAASPSSNDLVELITKELDD